MKYTEFSMLLDAAFQTYFHRTCSLVGARLDWRRCLIAFTSILFLGFSSNYAVAQLRETAPLHAWNDGANAGPLFTKDPQLVCDERRRLLNYQSPLLFVRGPNYAGSDPTNWTPAPYLDGGRCEDDQQRSLAFPRDGYYCLEGYEPQIDNSTEARCCIFGMIDPPGGVNGIWQGAFASATPRCRMYGVDPGKNQGCPKDGAAGGNPVNFGFANKYQTEVMFSTSPQLFFDYNSTPVGTLGATTAAPLGFGWTHNYDRRLLVAVTPQRSTTYAYAGGGVIATFNLVGSLWSSDLDVLDRLSDVLSGSTVVGRALLRADDSVEQYDLNGRLLSITSKSGIVQTMSYNANGQLVSVTDSFGRILSFTYNAATAASGANNLATAVDHLGNTLSYTYDAANNLNTATFPGGGVKTYVFNETTYRPYLYRNALTGIVDENSARYATYQYDSSMRPISTEHAGGVEKYQLNYVSPYAQTIVTDPLGTARTYNFQTILGVVKTTGVSQPCQSCGGSNAQATTYDINGNVSSRTDFNSKKSCSAYDLTRNLETSRIDGLLAGEDCATALTTPPARPDVRKTSTTWHTTYRLPLTITEPAAAATVGGAAGIKTTVFTYDSAGNLLTKKVSAGTELRTWTWTYNALGQVLTAKDPLNKTTTTAYYAATDTAVPPKFTLGDVQTVTNAVGHVTTFNEYDKNGRLRKMTDANGLVTTMSYHPRGWLTSRAVNNGTTTETTNYTYDNVGQLTRVTMPDGSILNYAYDDAHRLVGLSDQSAGVSIAGNGSLRMQLANLSGNKIVYTLDNMGNRIGESNFDPVGSLAKTKTRVIDSLNRLQKDVGGTTYATAPTQAITQYSYDNNGNVTATLDPLGRTTTNQYDALNRLTRVIDPYNGPTKATIYQYDNANNLTSVTDPESKQTYYTYNGHNNLIAQVSADTGTTQFKYNAMGNVVAKREAGNPIPPPSGEEVASPLPRPTTTPGRCTVTAYDPLDRPSTVKYYGDTDLSLTYPRRNTCFDDKISTLFVPEQTHTYTYDSITATLGGPGGKGRVSRISDATGRVDYVYNLNGRLTSKTTVLTGASNPNRVLTYTYNASGQMTAMTTPSGQTVSYVYGAPTSGNPGKVTGIQLNGIDLLKGSVYAPFGPNGGWTWGNSGATLGSSPPLNQHLRIFDKDYRPIAIASDPEGYNRNLTWDQANRITGIKVPSGLTLPGITNASSLNQAFAYDQLDRLTTFNAGVNGATTLATGLGLLPTETFTYDGIGNRKTRTTQAPGTTTTQSTSYAYGNTTPANHWLTALTGANAWTYAYDAAGNTIREGSDVSGAATTQYTLTYDAKNRLESTAIGSNGLDAVAYKINAMGQRVQKIGTGAYAFDAATATSFAYNARFVYDESGNLLGEYAPDGKLISETIWFNDLPVATLRPKGSNSGLPLGITGTGAATANNVGNNTTANKVNVDVYYLHPDHLGTPRVMTRSVAQAGATTGPNAVNKQVWNWNSDPFGTTAQTSTGGSANSAPNKNPQLVTGTAAQIAAASYEQNLRMPGQYEDQETKKFYNYFRDYDPNLGRFPQSDPIGLKGGSSTYGYVGGSPMNRTDEFGLMASGECTSIMCIPSPSRERLVSSRQIGISPWELENIRIEPKPMPPTPPGGYINFPPGMGFLYGMEQGMCFFARYRTFEDVYERFRQVACLEVCYGCNSSSGWRVHEEVLGTENRYRRAREAFVKSFMAQIVALKCANELQGLNSK
jgi:RHS repeat-associated protein